MSASACTAMWLLTLLLTLPAALLLVQVLLALLPREPEPMPTGSRPRVAVLVPAHNESTGVLPTLAQARGQLMPDDRILVVADNCSDDTANVARAAGVEVTARFEPTLRGKGYALDHGMRALAASPPDVVVVLDADCSLEQGCLERIARLAHQTGRPVQATYLMRAANDGLKMRVAEFAMRVKNLVRPRGMHRAGLPCGLMGTGMAFPWQVAQAAPWASGHLAEDMQLGVHLAQAGAPPLFCEDAMVRSVFAISGEGEKSQRTRWEHGHLSLLAHDGPRLLRSTLLQGQWRVALLVLDMLVPPLALLTMLNMIALALGGLAWLMAGWLSPLATTATAVLMLMAAIGLARARFAADILSSADLLRAPSYALAKVPLYLRFLVHRQVEWVRTKRDSEE